MSTKFFTNENENTLLEKFKGVFSNNKDIQFFDALVGYFRSSGYFSIRPFLNDVPNIRILVGIDVDKIIAKYHGKGLLFQSDPDQTVKEFLAATKDDIQSSKYTREVEVGILQFIKDIISKKIEIKAHSTKKLHAKIYIFRPEGFNEHKSGSVITGSSNLSKTGLGDTEEKRYEFNVLLSDFSDVKFATDEFEKLWGSSIPILPVEIEKIKNDTFLNDDPTPFEIYIKFLIEYFGRSVDFDPNSIADLPENYKRLSYQIDAVSQGYDLLMKHNGFFLADVVGLGKTVIATLIAKKFFFSNDYPSHVSNILVVFPPALKELWMDTFEDFDIKSYDWITNGSLHKIKYPDKYDLIIVDEAHKFRNDTTGAYTELQALCKTPTRHRLKNGKLAEKKVILVSATPLNNRPADIRNQVLLFQDGKDSTLDMSNLQSFFSQKIEAYKKALRKDDLKGVQKEVAGIYADIREKIIEPLTIRRTRTDLMTHEQYQVDLKEQGIVFPKVEKPNKIYYQLDAELEELYDETMMRLSHPEKGLQFFRYRAIEFLVPDKKVKYRNADLMSFQLARMMKTLLVKRIDSSFYAFRGSLRRFFDASTSMIKMFENERIFIAPNLKPTEYIMEEREDELIQLIAELADTDPTITICEPKDFEPAFYEGLQHDHYILQNLIDEWEQVDVEQHDPKVDEFINRIKNELFDPQLNPSNKLVVFSESKETIEHVTNRLIENKLTKILTVSADNRNKLKNVIKMNFDANINPEKQKNDFNIIISTEVLAEGINLHRANIVVNYDTPWNSTKLMQRIGRVNRIGTIAKNIYIYNFYPTSKVDTDIELEKKAIMKLQAFHSALGEDSQIYSPDEIVDTFGLFDETIEEDRDERLAYLMELRKFKTENPEYFRKIKNLPLRSRVGRKEPYSDRSTMCFIRNKRRDVFYRIKNDNSLDEHSFVETAEIFKTDADEKRIHLHGNHHDHVNIAVNDFNEKLKTESAEQQIVDAQQSPHEKSALLFMDAFLKLDFISLEESQKIKAAKNAIKLGKFQQLQRDMNKLKKSLKTDVLTPAASLDALLKLINKYPIDTDDDLAPPMTIKQYEAIQPEIIISESFAEK